MASSWLLSGIPRSGSSLCCKLAGQLPNVVALSEPIDDAFFKRTTDPVVASDMVVAFAAQARRDILTEGRAPSVHVAGRVTDQMVANDAVAARSPQTQRGFIEVPKQLGEDFTLVVKHNALFAALLPWLAPRLPCLAVVRNPVAVLASWDTVQLPVHQGRVPAAERFDRPLRTALDAEPDVLQRRIVVLNWFFACYERELPPARIIRYEDVVGSDGAVLRQALQCGGTGPVDALSSRNANPLYREVALEAILDALLAAGGPWTRFYAPCECRAVANTIQAAAEG